MNLNDIISKSAPLLGTLLGSPLAGIGISWIASLFGADPNNTQDIIDKITKDPESAIKLKALENQHEEELRKISVSNYQVEVDDRKNAREREIALHDNVPTVLAIGFLVCYAAIQFYCVIHTNSENDIISARFQDVLIMIISYYFGSSNKEKPSQP
jgi:hypothetical protein